VSATRVSRELASIRARTRRATGWSVLAHALLALLLATLRWEAAAPEGLVEVTWLEPAPAAAAAPAPAGEQQPEPPAAEPARVRFARERTAAPAAPRPQDASATQDRIRDRLASIQQEAVRPALQIAGLGASSMSSFPSLAGLPEGTAKSAPIGLDRSAPSQPPLDLARGRGGPSAAAPVLQRMAEAAAPPRAERPMAASGASRKVLAGMTLHGQVADRRLVSSARPQYPEWAQRELVEGSVRLYFEVLPSGRVKENVLVERTSGVEDFDRNATRALLSWRFEPVADGVGVQWGSITIDFRLNGARG
jgi:TonB family protein